jgi:hypothetical protein
VERLTDTTAKPGLGLETRKAPFQDLPRYRLENDRANRGTMVRIESGAVESEAAGNEEVVTLAFQSCSLN